MKRIAKLFLICTFLLSSFALMNKDGSINAATAGDSDGRTRAAKNQCDNVLQPGDWAMFGYNTFGSYIPNNGYRTEWHTFTIHGRTSYGLYNSVIGPYLPYQIATEIPNNEFKVPWIFQIKANNASNNTVLISVWNFQTAKYEDKWVKATYMIETTGKQPYTCVPTKQ